MATYKDPENIAGGGFVQQLELMVNRGRDYDALERFNEQIDYYPNQAVRAFMNVAGSREPRVRSFAALSIAHMLSREMSPPVRQMVEAVVGKLCADKDEIVALDAVTDMKNYHRQLLSVED